MNSLDKILFYENIGIRKEINDNELINLNKCLKRLCENIKFYQIKDLYELFIYGFNVVHNTNEYQDIFKTDRNLLANLEENFSKQKVKELPYVLLKIYKITKKYLSKAEKIFDNNLSIISAFISAEKEMDIEVIKEILIYLVQKLSDNLSDENCIEFNKHPELYQMGKINTISYKNFKIQNSYIINILNSLFFNYSTKFQKNLSSLIGKNFYNLFIFLNKLIYICNINENYKTYLYQKIQKNKKNLSYKLSGYTIKLLQNLCESHNQIFQNRFFDFNFDIENDFDDDKIIAEKEQEKPPPEINIPSQYNNRYSNKKLYKIPTLSPSKRKNDDEPAIRVGYSSNFGTQKVKKNFKIKQVLNVEEKKHEDNKTISMHNIFQNLIQKKKIEKENKLKKNELNSSSDEEDFMLHVKNLKEFDLKIENRNKSFLLFKKYSYLNFIIHNLRIIIENFHIKLTKQSEIFNLNNNFKKNHILKIFQKFCDLLIEMIQGTQVKNFDNFYLKINEKYQVLTEKGETNYKTLNSFTFLRLCFEIKEILFFTNDLFSNELNVIFLNLFTILVNIIQQNLKDSSIIQNLLLIFNPDKLFFIICNYLKGVNLKYLMNYDFEDEDFQYYLEKFQFTNNNYNIFKNYYKENVEIFNDDFFKLSTEMYLFLVILAKKYNIIECERIIKYNEKEMIEKKVDFDLNLKKFENDLNKIGNLIGDFGGNIMNGVKNIAQGNTDDFLDFNSSKNKLKRTKLINSQTINMENSMKNEINNFIITSKFYNKIIKTCEFVVENEFGKMDLKTIYFVIDPRVYYISKTNIDKFFDEVDRSSSTTKLKEFIANLEYFLYEVNFKFNAFKKANYLKWMFNIDYKSVDLLNFYCSLLINFILLLFLDKDPETEAWINYITVIIAGIQLFINLIYISIFFMSKYKFYVILAKSEYENKELELFDLIKIYFLDSFLFNDEIYLMILIMIMGAIGVSSKYCSFLFTLQLFSAIKFVATIKEIVIAFKLRITQLISMVLFLLILIFFYSNISYNFFPGEFNIETDEEGEKNICSSLLECTITYFNHGVRSGGGIGDLLSNKEFPSFMYWIRFFNDFIFFVLVSLMLLNMINGVIVSTFSQIREESNFKEEDISNKCFICNIDKVIFERLKIQFSEHLKFEHNVKNYIRFLVILKLSNYKDLDADQSYVFDCIYNKEIKCFPVGRSLSTGEIDEENENEDEKD